MASAPSEDEDDGRDRITMLYLHYRGRLAAYVRHLNACDSAPSECEAEDIVQDVFVRVWEGRDRLDLARLPGTFLYRVARNIVIDRMKHQAVARQWRNRQCEQPPRACMTPEDELVAAELQASLRSVLETCSPTVRSAFELVVVKGMPLAAAADILGVTPKAVERRKARAVQAIRGLLSDSS